MTGQTETERETSSSGYVTHRILPILVTVIHFQVSRTNSGHRHLSTGMKHQSYTSLFIIYNIHPSITLDGWISFC